MLLNALKLIRYARPEHMYAACSCNVKKRLLDAEMVHLWKGSGRAPGLLMEFSGLVDSWSKLLVQYRYKACR